jgi:hypothetical protein
MPTPTQITNVQSALGEINQAIPPVQTAADLANDPTAKLQLTQLGILLVNIQSTLTQALIASDDELFATDAAKLNTQAAKLKAQANSIQATINAIGTAAQVIGYITQALAFIAAI